MQEPIYFTKVVFQAYGALKYRVVLNIPRKELSYEKLTGDECVIWNYGIRLSEHQISQILPYVNVFDFEPFRNKEQSMAYEDGFHGYRDECEMDFVGISDSPVPKIELPMTVLYDAIHMWPNERLYQYLLKHYLSSETFKNEGLEYGSLSLFFG